MTDGLLFGAIADDYTGASDLASMLREGGVGTLLVFGDDSAALPLQVPPDIQAIVVALKSRSIPAAEAVRQSRAVLEGLRGLGVRQVHFKYCSTFDSTADGNIGPVTDALLESMETPFTVAVPALPVNGRTQYLGHLFVGDVLVSESHMRHHPVTPMTDANLVRHLQRQTQRAVGLVAHPVVRGGAEAVRKEMLRLQAEGVAVALVDAVSDADLEIIAEGVVDLPLTTGGSGLGISLPRVWRRRGWLPASGGPETRERSQETGGVAILAGSCSAVTLRQLETLRKCAGEGIHLDVRRLLEDGWEDEASRIAEIVVEGVRQRRWAHLYSSAGAEERAKLLNEADERGVSPDELRGRIEATTGRVARALVADGSVRALVIAGGETTGAVAEALELKALEVGDALDPGVPVLRTLGEPSISLVFKSGNFGSDDFFVKALRYFGIDAVGGTA